MYEIVVYETKQGLAPFDEWFSDLDTEAALKITAALARIEGGNLGDVKSVGKGVIERRITFGPGYRIYFGREGKRLIILLTGGTKKRQSNDIIQAQKFWTDYKKRKEMENAPHSPI